MRSGSSRLCLFFVSLWFAGAAGACAGDFTFFLGGVKPGKLSPSVVVNSLQSYDRLETSPVFGFRLSTSFVPMIGLEHTIAFSRDFLYPKASFPVNIPDTRGFIYNSNLILNFPTRTLVPYATAGVGLIRQYGSPDLPVGTKFAFNYGGGLKLARLFGPFGLRFDARGYTTSGLSFGGHLNLFEVSGGALFSF